MVLSVSRLRHVDALSFAADSFVIEGPAEACVGEIVIRNDSDRRLRLRGLPVALDGESAPSLGLRCRAALAPHSESRCAVRLIGAQRLATGTWPGRVVLPEADGPALSIRIAPPRGGGAHFTLATPAEGFRGPPDDCRACLPLVSTQGGAPQAATHLLARPAGGSRKRQRLPAVDYAVLHEGLVGDASVLRLALPSTTPPGRYELLLPMADGDAEVVAEVLPSTRLQLSPSMVTVQADAGAEVVLTLYIAHLGNVPVELPAAQPLWLEEVDWVGRMLVETLRACPREAAWTDYAQQLYTRFRQDMQSLARVAISPSDTPLAPGTTRLCQLVLTLPGSLRAGRRYRGFIRLHQQQCVLDVFCTG